MAGASGIEINPAHRGMLHSDLGVSPGKKLTMGDLYKGKHSKSAATRKRANFAMASRSWAKK